MRNSLRPEAAVYICVDSHAQNNSMWPITYGTSIMENQRTELKEAVSGIFQECQAADWDNEGSAPVGLNTWATANALIDKLPTLKVMGNAFATRNGNIGLQWLQPSGAAMSVLVEGSGKVIYAAILGDGRKKYGSEIFNGTLPSDVREQLLQVACKPAVPA